MADNGDLAKKLSQVAAGFVKRLGPSQAQADDQAPEQEHPSPESSEMTTTCPTCGAHNLMKNVDPNKAAAVSKAFK